LQQGQLSAANTAIANMAKLAGLWMDRSEIAAKYDIEHMSKPQIDTLLRDRFGEDAEELISWLERQAKRATANSELTFSSTNRS
jgi:hypothetical protein